MIQEILTVPLLDQLPKLESEVLRHVDGTSKADVLADGTVVLDTFDDYGKSRDPYHGLVSASEVRMHYSIHPDNPASATFRAKWNFTFERDDWQVAINTENEMTCDEENFYLFRKLSATEGGSKSEVLTREWEETIPRGLL